MSIAVKFENVSKIFKNGHRALQNVSFSVNQGQVVALIGPSGCGKTTTLRLINRLLEPSAGRVIVNDTDISETDVIQLRHQMGYVIQNSGLLPHMTIEENIGLLPSILKKENAEEISQRVEELMELVGLPPSRFKGQYPRNLSGGQQQRVGIARALINRPSILLMDEPFGALDPILRKELQNETLRLKEKLGKTIVIVTHDLIEAFRLADQVILMSKGQIVQQGTRKEFETNPNSEFVRDFVEAQLLR